MYMQSNLSSSIGHGTSRSQFLFLDVMAMERSELCFHGDTSAKGFVNILDTARFSKQRLRIILDSTNIGAMKL